MAEMAKFGAQMEADVLERLRVHAAATGQTLGWLLTRAVGQYLDQQELRPAFVTTAEVVMDEHADLLQRLAR